MTEPQTLQDAARVNFTDADEYHPLHNALGEVMRERLAADLIRARERTQALTEAVDEAELSTQHSPLMSPLVWDLAHIGNQEELWLVRDVGGREAVNSDIDDLYDAFQHARSDRPSLPLLNVQEARDYVAAVRGKALDSLSSAKLGDRLLTDRGFAFGMLVQHEQQHDETMLATHQLRSGAAALHRDPPPAATHTRLPAQVRIDAGEFQMGTTTEPWALDNERPAHPRFVEAFDIDTVPVSNGAYAQFIDAGGYRDRRLWTEDGWSHISANHITAPMGWLRADNRWHRRRFGATTPVIDAEPVVHVCFHEAQAYARWAGRRLPTEAEWEKAARFDPATGRSRRYPWGDEEPESHHANLGQRYLQPAPVGSYPDGASPAGVHQLIGDVWEWTSSDFSPYPGFAAFPYREYSEVFWGSDYKVLRGGSFGTDSAAIRGTFRNWDYPIRRQIFAGFRTAAAAAGS